MALTINAEDPKVIAATVDQAHAAVDEVVDRANVDAAAIETKAVGQLADILSGAVKSLEAIGDRAVAQLQGTINGLDGWTLQITIPPITIRLNKPKGN